MGSGKSKSVSSTKEPFKFEYNGETIYARDKTREELLEIQKQLISDNNRPLARRIADAVRNGEFSDSEVEKTKRKANIAKVKELAKRGKFITSLSTPDETILELSKYKGGDEHQPKEDHESYDPKGKYYTPSFPGVYSKGDDQFLTSPSGATRTAEEFERPDKGIDSSGYLTTKDRNTARNGGHWVANNYMGMLFDSPDTVPFTIFLCNEKITGLKDGADLGTRLYLDIQFRSGYDSKHDENLLKYSKAISAIVHRQMKLPVKVSFESLSKGTFMAAAKALEDAKLSKASDEIIEEVIDVKVALDRLKLPTLQKDIDTDTDTSDTTDL